MRSRVAFVVETRHPGERWREILLDPRSPVGGVMSSGRVVSVSVTDAWGTVTEYRRPARFSQ